MYIPEDSDLQELLVSYFLIDSEEISFVIDLKRTLSILHLYL